MKTGQADVKSKSQVVGTAEFEIFDSTEEAEEHLGKVVVLGLINKQRKTDKLNEMRQSVTGKPSKEAMRNQALAEMSMQEFESIRGNPEALKALVEKKMAEIEANLPVGQAPGAPGVDEVEDLEA